MALTAQTMDVTMDDASCVAPPQSTNFLAVGKASYQRAPEPAALVMDIASMSISDLRGGDQTQSLQIPRSADTPCPSASQPGRRGGVSYVLLPDGNRRPIELGAGMTVVGRSKEYGIKDCHVSRRHVEVTVPEKGADGSEAGCCHIKYIGRNCRTVVVDGILLKAEQEVVAGPGTKVILNLNNKGLPQYTYTLVPAGSFPALARSAVARQCQAAMKSTWSRGAALTSLSPAPQAGLAGRCDCRMKYPMQQQQMKSRRPLLDSLSVMKRKRAQVHARFRKEKQEKLQKEREEILKKFAELNVS